VTCRLKCKVFNKILKTLQNLPPHSYLLSPQYILDFGQPWISWSLLREILQHAWENLRRANKDGEDDEMVTLCLFSGKDVSIMVRWLSEREQRALCIPKDFPLSTWHKIQISMTTIPLWQIFVFHVFSTMLTAGDKILSVLCGLYIIIHDNTNQSK
jgi:hypothetical protein